MLLPCPELEFVRGIFILSRYRRSRRISELRTIPNVRLGIELIVSCKLPIIHAAHTWLNNEQDLHRDCSLDCLFSHNLPKPGCKLADKEPVWYCSPLFQPIEPGQDKETLLKLRVMVDTMSLETFRQLNSLLSGGHFTHLNRMQWLKVAQL